MLVLSWIANLAHSQVMLQLLLQGRPAFSNFRIQALLVALNDAAAKQNIIGLEAVEIYCIDTVEPLDDRTTKRVYSLLNAKQEFECNHGFFVTPRKGTISPWSSKATDILHNCGLKKVLRVERGIHFKISTTNGLDLGIDTLGLASLALHDRMTEAVYTDLSDFFSHYEPANLRKVPLIAEGPKALHQANLDWGLAMTIEEIEYLVTAYQKIGRDPTDAELVMFSQVNSEHCRHKIFNADWIIDGSPCEQSLFKMIRNTQEINPEGVLVAYSDNSGVLEGSPGDWWEVAIKDGIYSYRKTPTYLDILCKVETHNHPTAISPFPGAATGVGGEIRDEGATGIGGRPKAGLSAFMVSD
ncbi:MAG: phosphoribosylformylglycinamidine synthase, partial [Verrucomicrobiota bacterium]|nr:phosphoribosylformylglycinamidine synthase [Verrucomicrobiota bacterium]